MKTITVSEFKSYFAEHYPYIQHDLSDKQIYRFLNRANFRGQSLKSTADQFSDYLLANDIADVQE